MILLLGLNTARKMGLEISIGLGMQLICERGFKSDKASRICSRECTWPVKAFVREDKPEMLVRKFFSGVKSWEKILKN